MTKLDCDDFPNLCEFVKQPTRKCFFKSSHADGNTKTDCNFEIAFQRLRIIMLLH